MSEEDTIGPLLAVRDRLDEAIKAYLDKVAVLRKRREAVHAAIDIVRAGDDEIMKLPTLAHKNGKPRVIKFDAGAVESRVIDILASGETSYPQIRSVLESEAIPFTIAGLKAILRTCPKVERRGERDQTSYRLRP